MWWDFLYAAVTSLQRHGQKLWYFLCGGLFIVSMYLAINQDLARKQRISELTMLIRVDRESSEVRKNFVSIINDFSMPREFRAIVERSLANYDADTAYRICLIDYSNCKRFNEEGK